MEKFEVLLDKPKIVFLLDMQTNGQSWEKLGSPNGCGDLLV